MADEKKLKTPEWLGRPILDEGHSGELEQRAAIHEFMHKLPRAEAEAKAHDEYVKEHRQRAAAHHLQGMKAAQATGNVDDARKHYLLYELHAKALGHEPVGPVPPEIRAKMEDPDQKPMYKFKAHKGDLYALQEQKKPEQHHGPQNIHGQELPVDAGGWPKGVEQWGEVNKAEIEVPDDHKIGMRVPAGGSSCASCKFVSKDGKECGQPDFVKWNGGPKLPAPADEYCCDFYESTSMEKSEAKRCKWRLGERRCQRMVKGDYCHDHVDHWANKIKSREDVRELSKSILDGLAETLRKLAKGDVVPFQGNPNPAKRKRKNAEVVAIPTDANTTWDAPGDPDHNKIVDPVGRNRAAAGAVPKYDEPKLVARGAGMSHNVYDYTHMLDPIAQKNGATLEIRHSPGRFDDVMIAQVKNNLGQTTRSTVAYPSTMLSTSPSEDVGMWNAIRNHQNWVKFAPKK